MRLLAVPLVAVLLTSGLRAQPPDVTRVLRNFDFEERRLGNDEDLPMNWTKVEGPGFPHYVGGQLTTDKVHSGKYSFRLDLNGGSLLYRYDPSKVRVQTGACYRIQGFCATTVLTHARARISAYFTDMDGHLLPRTLHHSELYAATAPNEPWKELSIDLTASEPSAAFLVIEIGLLQPDIYAPASLGKRSLFLQDIHGSAWFDDISVSQVPRVTLATDRPGNIFRAGDPLRLRVLVSDRFTDDLQAQLVIQDAAGESVYQRSGAIDLQTSEVVEAGTKRVSVDLPDLHPGWYEASLQMSSQGRSLGDQKLDLILLADAATASNPDPRFGIVATDLPFDGWSELPQILPYLSAGRVKLGLWTQSGDVQQLDPVIFDRLLESLQQRGITPTACLLAVPPSIASKIGGSEWNRLLKVDASEWQPQLAYLISRHANHLDRWQIGSDGSDVFVTDPQMRKVYARFYREFSQLMDNPDLAMPWPAWYELQGELPATVALSVSPTVLPSQLPLYIQDLKKTEGHNLSLTIQPLDIAQYGRQTQIRDFAQRVIYAMSAGASRIDLPLPFTVERAGDQVVQQPKEMFMILRTLTMLLSGAVYQGKVPLGEGIEAFLFDRGGQGIMAVWDRGNSSGVRPLSLNLGENATRIDLWGNATPLFHSSTKGDDHVPLVIGPDPFFLVDIDGAQAQLRASVSVDRPLIESSFEPHLRQLTFTNRYHQSISGSLKLKAPAGWTLNPPTFQFSLNPGESFKHEISIEFPYNSYAGSKTIQCEFSLSAERSASFSVPLVLQLGLSDVGMQSLALRDGKDVVVQQIITNYGEKPIDYSAFAVYPGQARQERLVTNLGSGRTILKKYRFTEVELKPGAVVRVGVKELSGTRILNDEIEVR